jgi:hypothetical protein
MFKNLFSPPFFLDEGDAGGKADDQDKADDSDEGVVTDPSDDDGNDDDTSTDEQKKVALAAFKKRKQKRNYFVELDTRISSIEGKLTELATLNSDTSAKKGRPKGEESQVADSLDKIMASISDLKSDVEKRFESVTSELAKERMSSDRREMLVEAGVKPKIISAMIDGTINVPSGYWDDERSLYGFIDKFDGFVTKSSGKKADGTDDGKKKAEPKKSVPHTDLSDAGKDIQNDKKGQGGISDALKAIDDEIDTIIKGAEKDAGGILSTESLTKLMKLSDTADSSKK